MSTWHDTEPDLNRRYGPRDWLRILRRGLPLALVTFGGLGVLLLLRVIERPLFGLRRPLTPFITQGVCRAAFVIMGIKRQVRGRPMRQRGAAVANHASWLDIFALNASKRIYFVSKSEVAAWPGIGWLARATGTVFIHRTPAQARAQQAVFEARLRAGHRLMFFPEGTSTDGLRVLPFKSTLFAAFFHKDLPALHIQPVAVAYHAPPDAPDPRFYGWWGAMDFGPHLLQVLAAKRQGSVAIHYLPPIAVAETPDRKSLAKTCEEAIRAALLPPERRG